MQPVQLPDQLYQQAQQRAHAAGFQSVDEYVAQIVESDVSAASEDFDHFFTPEIVAELDQIRAEIQAGAKTYSSEEVDEFFRQKSQAWRETHGN
jgi:hypothetical protein